mgnify:CR=1 FL=1
MIIKDLQLTNFGKFNHKSMSLEPGLNIIYGENEAGKTTFHTFIRGMLFGIEKQRGKASSKDTYSKYEPWDNPSNYQGMMRIESNGVDYRIERNFNRQNKSFKVINEDLGRELTQDEIDKLFTGLDESCYYNTISISQLGSATDKELENILKIIKRKTPTKVGRSKNTLHNLINNNLGLTVYYRIRHYQYWIM